MEVYKAIDVSIDKPVTVLVGRLHGVKNLYLDDDYVDDILARFSGKCVRIIIEELDEER